jgi:hypothetical protein
MTNNLDNKLNVVTFITKDYLNIFGNYFLPTLPEEIESITTKCVNIGGYHRHSNYALELEKVRTKFIIEQITAHMGQNLFMIDSDVVFSGRRFVLEINDILSNYDFAFQNNTNWYNFGVFAIRCNDKTLDIFYKLLDRLNNPTDNYCKTLDERYDDGYFLHDQHIINDLVRENDVTHTSLPLEYFAGHFGSMELPSEWILYHATNTLSMEEKIQVLERKKNKI